MSSIYTTPEVARIETAAGGLNSNNSRNPDEIPDALKTYKEHSTLDDAEQWTCNPGTRAEVRDGDELYDRKADPFQLNNIIADHPDVAAELLQKLTAFMLDLSEM